MDFETSQIITDYYLSLEILKWVSFKLEWKSSKVLSHQLKMIEINSIEIESHLRSLWIKFSVAFGMTASVADILI